jgi:RNA polymerase sigma factor (sigma-70 family)
MADEAEEAETDEAIVRRVRRGDREAFARLVDRYRGMVYGLAFHHLGNIEDARDVAQETFVNAFGRLNQLRDPTRFAPWLRQVTTNACRAWRRRDRPTQELPEDLPARDDAASRTETRLVVEAALACLSPATRRTLMLFYAEERSLAEIAAFLGVPVTTIKSRLRDARARLRKELLEMNEEMMPKPLPADFTARVMRRLTASGAVRVVALSPDGRWVAHNVEHEDKNGEGWGEIQVWDSATGNLVRSLRVERIGRDLLFSPDGACVGRGCGWQPGEGRWASAFRLWDIATGALAARYEVADGGTISGLAHSAAFSPDSRRLATGSALYAGKDAAQRWGEVRLWDAVTGDLLHTARHRECVWAVAFSPDGSLLASSSGTGLKQPGKNGWVAGDVRLWDTRTGELLRILDRPHAANQCTLAFSPDGTRLATGDGPEGDVLVWDTRTDTSPRRFSGHAREVYAVAFSPDGMLLASGSRDATVHLWDVASGALRATLSGHDSSVQGVAFSPAGHTLASADLGPYYPGEPAKNHGSVRLWRIK